MKTPGQVFTLVERYIRFCLYLQCKKEKMNAKQTSVFILQLLLKLEAKNLIQNPRVSSDGSDYSIEQELSLEGVPVK